MKILLATSSINLRGGGISSYAIDFINVYNNEHEFIVISNDILDDNSSQTVRNYYRVPSTDLSFNNILRLLDIINECKPDIILNSNFPLLSIAIPFIDNKIIKLSISHLVDGKLSIIAGFNHLYYDTIISLSQAGSLKLRNYFKTIKKDKIAVIYNFYNQIIKKSSVKNNIINIVFPGGSNINKNPILVFKILESLSKTDLSFRFYWLGNTILPGSKFFGKFYISNFLQNDNRISFTGNLPRNESVRIIQNADIFLLPSKREGCPITLLEAMSVGTIPMVSDAKHASSEIIQNGKTGFVLSNTDSGVYIEMIKNIIQNPKKYANIVDHSFETFKENFSPEMWKSKMDALFIKKNAQQKITLAKSYYLYFLFTLKFRLIIARLFTFTNSLYYFIALHFIKIAYKLKNK